MEKQTDKEYRLKYLQSRIDKYREEREKIKKRLEVIGQDVEKLESWLVELRCNWINSLFY